MHGGRALFNDVARFWERPVAVWHCLTAAGVRSSAIGSVLPGSGQAVAHSRDRATPLGISSIALS